MRILFEAQDRGQDAARRVVNSGEEHQAGAAVLEPGMLAAIHLDEEARLGHALAPAAMAWWAAGAGTTDASLTE